MISVIFQCNNNSFQLESVREMSYHNILRHPKRQIYYPKFSTNLKNHRMLKLSLEGTRGGHLVQPYAVQA